MNAEGLQSLFHLYQANQQTEVISNEDYVRLLQPFHLRYGDRVSNGRLLSGGLWITNASLTEGNRLVVTFYGSSLSKRATIYEGRISLPFRSYKLDGQCGCRAWYAID